MLPKKFTRAARGALAASWLLSLSPPTHALGLGPATANPVLGRPLRVEIELFGSDRETAAAQCFKIARPQNPIDDHYALHGAQLAIERSEGRSYLVVSHPSIQNPVVEFTVQINCGGANLARDYVLLASPEVVAKPVVAPAPVPAIAVAVQNAAKVSFPNPAPAKSAVSTGAVTTLEQMARRQYPNQPKAREKYKRMMRAANAALFPSDADTDHHPIPTDANLAVPVGLPERRQGPYLPPTPAKKTATAVAVLSSQAVTAPPPSAVARSGDRLQIGAAPPASPAATEAGLTRIENLHAELNQTQEQIADKLALAEAAFVELKNHLLRMENRIRELEAERVQEAGRRKIADMVQLVLAVLIGGVAGAALLHFVPRHLARRRRAADAVVNTAPPVPMRVAAAHPGMVSAFAALHQVAADAPTGPPSDSPSTVQTEPPPSPAGASTPETAPAAPEKPAAAPFDFDFVSWVPEGESSGKPDQPLPPPSPR